MTERPVKPLSEKGKGAKPAALSVSSAAAQPASRYDAEDAIIDAFVAGFKASGEGYNGEYPFDECEKSIRRELWEQIAECRDEIFLRLANSALADRNDSEDRTEAEGEAHIPPPPKE